MLHLTLLPCPFYTKHISSITNTHHNIASQHNTKTHHKEIGLTVDTAKLIMAAFPKTTRLVVSGINREYQPTMDEMLHAVSDATMSMNRCLILFPTDDALTFDEIMNDLRTKEMNILKEEEEDNDSVVDPHAAIHDNKTNDDDIDKGWDVVVIDGTWSQARKMHAKYLQESTGGCLYRVQLSDEAVQALDRGHDDNATRSANVQKGHQLRRHPIKWREISTLEATRLLLNDMHTTNGEFEEQSTKMAYYQEIGNDAARRQLGPLRV